MQDAQNLREIIVLFVAFLGVLGTFASVVAMFVSVKKTVESQSHEIDSLKKELKEIRIELATIIRLEERMKNVEARSRK